MSISFDIPELEDHLRAGYANLNEAAKQALLIDAYRTGKLSIGRLAQAIGQSVTQTHDWLAQHRVGPSYTADDLDADQNTLRRFRESRAR